MNLNEDPSGQTATTNSSGNEEENWRKQDAASGNRQKAVIEAIESSDGWRAEWVHESCAQGHDTLCRI